MTDPADRPHLLPEEFEDAARALARTVEGLRMELLNGRVGFKAMPDGNHSEIIACLQRQWTCHRPELGLYAERGLCVEVHRHGRARPDGTLAARGSFSGQGEWADPEHVLMVVEVTSYDSDSDRRDRVEKPRAYAETGIPLYLLIDRDAGTVTIHTDPDGVRYESTTIVPFGKRVTLPEPVGMELDTEPLTGWVR